MAAAAVLTIAACGTARTSDVTVDAGSIPDPQLPAGVTGAPSGVGYCCATGPLGANPCDGYRTGGWLSDPTPERCPVVYDMPYPDQSSTDANGCTVVSTAKSCLSLTTDAGFELPAHLEPAPDGGAGYCCIPDEPSAINCHAFRVGGWVETVDGSCPVVADIAGPVQETSDAHGCRVLVSQNSCLSPPEGFIRSPDGAGYCCIPGHISNVPCDGFRVGGFNADPWLYDCEVQYDAVNARDPAPDAHGCEVYTVWDACI